MGFLAPIGAFFAANAAAITAGAAVAGAGLAAGAAVSGADAQRRARHTAEDEAKAQRQFQGEQSKQIEERQNQLLAKQDAAQKKVNAGVRRSNRRRIKGGLFGEESPTPGPISTTLG